MSVAIFSPTPYINKWQMSLCNNSSDNKSYWIHRVDVKVSAQVTIVTYMHQSQPSLHSLRKYFTVHLELWPGKHFIWCNATFIECLLCRYAFCYGTCARERRALQQLALNVHFKHSELTWMWFCLDFQSNINKRKKEWRREKSGANNLHLPSPLQRSCYYCQV